MEEKELQEIAKRIKNLLKEETEEVAKGERGKGEEEAFKCEDCGSGLREGQKFCRECGARYEWA